MKERHLTLFALALSLAACSESIENDQAVAESGTDAARAASQRFTQVPVTKLLSLGGIFAESSYMACIASLYAQGLPFRLIFEQCAVSLNQQGELGFGSEGKEFEMPEKSEQPFNAAAITSACGGGDPRLTKPAYQQVGTLNPFDGKTVDDWGGYSYGKSTHCDSWGCYQGMKEADAEAQKQKWIEEAYDAEAAFRAAAEAYVQDPKNDVKKDEMEHRKRLYEEAKEKAKQDPNKKPVKAPAGTVIAGDANGADDGTTAVAHGAGEDSTCALVLQSARELLAECHRTGWKSTPCQVLHARVNRCPDPTLIYVDPESGYACAPPVDSQAVIDAWVKRCEQTATPGPDGGSSCTKPKPSELGMFLTADETNKCSSPIAHTNPDEDGCIAPLVVDDFGRPDIDGLIVWGQGVFGGPIVVLPPRPLPFPY